MLDAVRICGRWVRQLVLDRLSAKSAEQVPPSRGELVRRFCRMTHWVNRKGQPCVSSANVALNRLEAQGRVKLTPPAPRKSKSARKLVDDGQPLPSVLKVPGSVGQIKQLHLQLIRDAKDPDHRLWNRLIARHHCLKDTPLVGWRLRYLIRSEHGVLGALAFGPPAYHLECRDRWIGWDRQAQQGNRYLVIGLSRCLLRPEVRCANLLSTCYSLVLARVAQDWHQRYGIKPVLVETYVDRATHAGTSLSAANWRRLGSSAGRGRDSPSSKVRPKTPKDLWVYELDPKARELLQARRAEPIAPRSIFQSMGDEGWVAQELDGLYLGHALLNRRWAKMLQSRWNNPQRSFAASFEGTAATKAAYRLIRNPQSGLGFESLLAPHLQQTQRRMAAESVVVLAQDTTPLSYNGLIKTQGLGPMGKNAKAGRGLWLHSLMAFRLDAIPLGCAWAHLWARPAQSDTDQRNQQSIDQKESQRWIEAYQQALFMAQGMPQTQLVVVGDRESDLFELYDQTLVAPSNLHLLVRVQHDRVIQSGEKLFEHLARLPSGGTMQVKIPRNKNRSARVATLSLKWGRVEINPPQVALKKSWRPIGLYVVMAQEVDPPPGEEPIRWILFTDWSVGSLKTARRMVRWYALRWGIECWHQVLKDVCGVETRQMESAGALERALVLDMIVSWRAQFLCRLGKVSPNLPASLFYAPEELSVLEEYHRDLPERVRSSSKQRTPEASSPTSSAAEEIPAAPESKKKAHAAERSPGGSELNLLQANILVAMLAGFLARKCDGHPGAKTLARGLEILEQLVQFRRRILASQPAAKRKQPSKPKRSREPD